MLVPFIMCGMLCRRSKKDQVYADESEDEIEDVNHEPWVGADVILRGLAKIEYNGLRGRILKHVWEKDRWAVEVTIHQSETKGTMEIKELSLKKENLKVMRWKPDLQFQQNIFVNQGGWWPIRTHGQNWDEWNWANWNGQQYYDIPGANGVPINIHRWEYVDEETGETREYFYDDNQNYVDPNDYDENGYYIGELPADGGYVPGTPTAGAGGWGDQPGMDPMFARQEMVNENNQQYMNVAGAGTARNPNSLNLKKPPPRMIDRAPSKASGRGGDAPKSYRQKK